MFKLLENGRQLKLLDPVGTKKAETATATFFQALDLSRDERISYNEFLFLLLRNNLRIDEK